MLIKYSNTTVDKVFNIEKNGKILKELDKTEKNENEEHYEGDESEKDGEDECQEELDK